MDLWKNYKTSLANVFPDMKFVQRHAEWTNDKGVNLTADLYKGDHIKLTLFWYGSYGNE